MKGKKPVRYRSAITGRYVRPWVVERYPKTTVAEAVKPCKPRKRK